MTYRWTDEDLAKFQRNSGRGLPIGTVRAMEEATGKKLDPNGEVKPKVKKAAKYHNLPTEVDGVRFHSKLEAKYFVELELRRRAGDVKYFLRQVPFHLPGGVIYRVDFQVFLPPYLPRATGEADPQSVRVEYIDTKGVETQECRNKIKMVKALYGVDIEIVRKVKSQGAL